MLNLATLNACARPTLGQARATATRQAGTVQARLLIRTSSFQSGCCGCQTPSAFAASCVPATRARIFANAVSRGGDVSSPNGANPQSSVVPQCSGGVTSAP